MKVQEKNTAKVKLTYSATKVKARIFLRDFERFLRDFSFVVNVYSFLIKDFNPFFSR